MMRTDLWRCRGWAILFLAAMLTGCASVPLGTMIKLARYSVDDLIRVDPGAIRAAVSTHHQVDFGQARLSLRVEQVDEERVLLDEAFELERVPDWAHASLALPPADEQRHWIVFRVREQDTARFISMQQQLFELSQLQQKKSLSLNVSAQQMTRPDGMDRVPVAIDLRLAEDQGFFTLIKERELELEDEAVSDD